MSRALELANRGMYTTDPNPRVGCVLVRDDRIVGEGWHQRAGEAHAEVNALTAAGEAARGATAYISLEPCCFTGRTGPCTEALIDAGISRVVAATLDPNPKVAGRGLARLTAAGIDVSCGLLEAEALHINPGFTMRMSVGRPFVRCKLAASLDGRTAMASGESQWITGPAARDDVQRYRARSSAIVTGSGTVRHDDPALTVRIPDAQGRQPLRVVLDSNGQVSPMAKLFQTPTPVLLVRSDAAPNRTGQSPRPYPAHVESLTLPTAGTGVELSALMTELAAREINEVHLECGARLAGAFLVADLIDELVVYMAPVLLGDGARGLFHLPGLDRMAERVHLELCDLQRIGDDWRMTLRPRRGRDPASPSGGLA